MGPGWPGSGVFKWTPIDSPQTTNYAILLILRLWISRAVLEVSPPVFGITKAVYYMVSSVMPHFFGYMLFLAHSESINFDNIFAVSKPQLPICGSQDVQSTTGVTTADDAAGERLAGL